MSADLVDCDDISEAAIMQELKARFQQDVIYSAIGPIIIALNPYKDMPQLYSAAQMQTYSEPSFAEAQPHVWTIAQAAYSQLRTDLCRQAIVISGESGAGKTEATKRCLQFLSAVGATAGSGLGGSRPGAVPVEDRVLATGPVLESFGNAKTAKNNNSSRFGKWRSSTTSSALVLKGAHITQYLLEKTRVVVQGPEERNYHIFYQ
ncbi:P-loop containing nucleoside triphosphate hydrolase protein, partial [Ochromonadaceae sp. CCMP2298]